MGKIITQCEHCKQKMNVDEEFVGKKIRCPNCKNTFHIEEFKAQAAAKPSQDDAFKKPASSAPFAASSQTPTSGAPFAEEDEEMETITEEYKEEAPKAPSFAAEPAKTYNEPKICAFKNMMPKGAKIVGEYNLGCTGWIVPESTKVMLTENEVFLYSSRRYIFGIFPGGKKLASYPIEFHQMRTGILKYKSLFAALLFMIFGLAIGLGAWFVAKTAGAYEETDKMYNLKTMFDFSEDMQTQTKLSKLEDATTTEEKAPAENAENVEQNQFMDNVWSFIKMAWYYLIPFVIAFIWVFIFWRPVYKTCLFTVPISRFRKTETQECLRKINEQALRIQ